MPIYKNKVEWRGEHMGYTWCGNGAETVFSAPPDLYGASNILTPEDAFMAASNTCYHMMVVWVAERFKMDLVSFECEAVGEVEEFIDRTSWFKKVTLYPKLVEVDSLEGLGRCHALRLDALLGTALGTAVYRDNWICCHQLFCFRVFDHQERQAGGDDHARSHAIHQFIRRLTGKGAVHLADSAAGQNDNLFGFLTHLFFISSAIFPCMRSRYLSAASRFALSLSKSAS